MSIQKNWTMFSKVATKALKVEKRFRAQLNFEKSHFSFFLDNLEVFKNLASLEIRNCSFLTFLLYIHGEPIKFNVRRSDCTVT